MGARCKSQRAEYKHILKVFPVRLKELMGAMTLVDLSCLSGVNITTLSNWARGKTCPDLICLFAICNVLDASIDYLVGLDADGAPKHTLDDTQADNVAQEDPPKTTD